MNNTYSKYCPNVFLLKTDHEFNKDDETTIMTRYGNENDVIIHNLVYQKDGFNFYSITRADGFNSQERARRKADRIGGWVDNANARSAEWYQKSNEGKEFLSLAEPIKVGHHSEKRHRNLIERNWKRTVNSFKEAEKAKDYQARAEYWEQMAKKVDLSMPESLEFFKLQLDDAIEYHSGLKDGSIEREHSYSLAYAKKRVNELKKKYDIAVKLWGEK